MTLADLFWPPSPDDERDERIGHLEAQVEQARDQRMRLSDEVIFNMDRRTRYAIARGTREELLRVRHYVRGDE